MTQQLTILTPFADLAELTENFAQRVDEQRLMLPYAEAMPEGEWIQFEVQLADGTAALQGVGKVQGAFDNGEEHPPEYRFDLVLEELQLEGMHEVMFERLLVARETQLKGEPVTGEVSVEELEREQAARTQSVAADGAWDDPNESTIAARSGSAGEAVGAGEVDLGDLDDEPAVERRAAAPRAVPRREPVALPSPHAFNGRALTRPSYPPAWSPEPAPRRAAAQSSGYFDYQGGVPCPTRPPRPELDPTQRVQPAPRPGAPWPRRATGTPSSEPDLASHEQQSAQLEVPLSENEQEEW